MNDTTIKTTPLKFSENTTAPDIGGVARTPKKVRKS